jgi:hypothetical protein
MTANPLRGEADFGGRKLVIDFNGFCRLEVETGKKVVDLLSDFDTGLGFSDLRSWLRVFVQPEPSDEEVEQMVTADGVEAGYRAALKAIAESMAGFMAKPKAEKENPRKAA